jgi:2,3-bisphosphoglycerate-independent phosphoglycerate mutase
MSEGIPKPVVLMILDGWGVAPAGKSNAITSAKTPTMEKLIKTYPAMVLQSSGEAVGLSWGEIGNSEVGHLALGSGKLVYQSLPRIAREIGDGTFAKNEKFKAAAEHARKNKSALHLMGIVSTGNVHGSADHLYALMEFAAQEKISEVYIHCFLDGRDMPFNSGVDFIKKIQQKSQELGVGKIATMSGPFLCDGS